jgi:EAL domain-containing protein (putative c-di-GMP-specific phosphodiesterase class I)
LPAACGWRSRLDQDAEGRAIVYAITSLATALGVRVTGEGIETDSQRSTLMELDCNHGQGFLLGRPVPAEEMAALLQTIDLRAETRRPARGRDGERSG